MTMPADYQAVMFDLDGTLLDTLTDIATAGNRALATVGRPGHATEAYRHLAGQGAPWLIEHALGPDHQHLAGRALVAFNQHILDHGLDHTQPYDGIADLLDELTRRGIKLAVLSNKPHAATCEAVAHRLGRWRFDAVEGHRIDDPAAALKPDPSAALAIADRTGIAADRWLYLGDTRVDMLTGRAAGMFTVGCLWGFRDQTELLDAGAQGIVAHPRDVLPLVEGQPAWL